MMIKFHSAGRSGRAAAEYLEAEKDHKDRERENVEVLRRRPIPGWPDRRLPGFQTSLFIRGDCLGAGGQADPRTD